MTTYFPEGSKDPKYKTYLTGQVRRNSYSLFAQNIYQFNDYAAVTSGVRRTAYDDFENQLDYRIALTANKDRYYTKVLVGTAHRVPTYREYLKIFEDDWIGPVPLEPERMLTFEWQLGYQFTNSDINLTFYRNLYKDYIKEIETQTALGIDIDEDEYAYNLEQIDTMGLELAWLSRPIDELTLKLSASVIFKAEEEPGEAIANADLVEEYPRETHDVVFLAEHLASLSAAYQLTDSILVGGSLNYVGKRNSPENYQTWSKLVEDNQQQLSNLDGYFILNLHSRVQLTPSISMKFEVKNLFNEQTFGHTITDPTEYDNENPGYSIGVYLQAQF